jgi:hypothetical protein
MLKDRATGPRKKRTLPETTCWSSILGTRYGQGSTEGVAHTAIWVRACVKKLVSRVRLRPFVKDGPCGL